MTQPATVDDLKYWLGVVAFILSSEISQTKETIMATLADLTAADADLTAEVAQIGTDVTTALQKLSDVEAELAALQDAGLTPDQQAQVDAAVQSVTDAKAALSSTDTAVQTALAPPAP